jgi:hypothetical protein
MTSRKQLKRLAQIALLLLVAGTVGFLAGQVDDDDDNFGLASLEPCMVLRHNGRSSTSEAPVVDCNKTTARITAVREVQVGGPDSGPLPTRRESSFAIPLRT